MMFPSPTTPEGLFDYLMAVILVVAGLFGAWFLLVWLGVLPPFL